MKVSRKIAWLLIPLVVILLLGATGAGYFLYQEQQQNTRIEQRILPALDVLRETGKATDYFIEQLQARALGDTLARPEALAASKSSPKAFLQKFVTLSKSEQPDAAAVEQLRIHLDVLSSTARELLIRLRAPAAVASNEKRNKHKAEDAQAAYDRTLPQLVRQVKGLRDDILQGITTLSQQLLTAHDVCRQQAQQSAALAYLILTVTAVVVLFWLLLATWVLQRGVAAPLGNLLANLNGDKRLAEGSSELGLLGSYLNQYRLENHQLGEALDKLADNTYEDDFAIAEVKEGTALRLNEVVRRLRRSREERDYLKEELSLNRRSNSETGNRLRQLEEAMQTLTAKLQALENSVAIAELDAEGKLVYTDPVFAQLSGYTADELKGKEFARLNGNQPDNELYRSLWQTVQSGKTWYGVVQNKAKNGNTFWLASTVTPIANGKANGASKYLFTGTEVSVLKQEEQELKNTLQTTRQDLEQYKHTLQGIQAEHQRMQTSIDSQKQLQYRLTQQQAALQELTRNTDLKEGNVREALRFLTETTAHALEEYRVGLWLFTENGAKLRCIDLYERPQLAHMDSMELRASAFPNYFHAVQQERVVAVEATHQDERSRELAEAYLTPFSISSLMSAPIHLGGSIVGNLQVEHTGEAHPWTLDEQNFVLSVADVVSLALEQGNRRVMEEELRMTLEESQALEEELRQNAEEIEATNEEMRRTQAELRGQINALNNAAVVSETNVKGLITYANTEFSKIYKFDKRDVLGQNHRMMKSTLHPASFYEHLWKTITSGRVWKGEIKNRSSDGQDVWVALTITPVLGVDSQPYKFIGVAFNITAQKGQEGQIKQALDVALQQEEMLRENAEELEYANEEMRRTQIELAGQINALNNSSLVYETDMDGNITYVNDELLHISKYKREDLIGKRYTLLKSGLQSDGIYQEQWRTVLNGRIWQGELELKGKQGDIFWVMMTNTPVLDDNGEPIKSINVLFDITAQKQQEFRLRKQQAAMLELASHPTIQDGNIQDALEEIARIGRETLGTYRTSLYTYDDSGQHLHCISSNQEAGAKDLAGALLDPQLYPLYFESLERDRIIAAADAQADPRTKELAFNAYKPEGIVSILDAAVRQGPRTVGLITFEARSPRTWTLDEQSFAGSLADTVGLVLEQKERQVADQLKLAYAQLEEKNQEVLRQKHEIEEQTTFLTESIKYAKRIQQNILPSKEVMGQYMQNYFVVYKPRDVVGGDFYWFAAQGSKQVIVVADGTGHGVPGAFLTLIGYLLLNQIVNEKHVLRPADILYHMHLGVRTALKQDEEGSESRDGFDMAVCVFDSESYVAEFAGANLPFNYYQDFELNVVKPDKRSIGGEQMEEERIFTNHTIQLKQGDAIYMYTDGFVDQMGGPEDKRFSTKRFRDLVLRTQNESMATQRALVNLEWKEWKDDREQLDDVTVFGLKL